MLGYYNINFVQLPMQLLSLHRVRWLQLLATLMRLKHDRQGGLLGASVPPPEALGRSWMMNLWPREYAGDEERESTDPETDRILLTVMLNERIDAVRGQRHNMAARLIFSIR